jgi:hypothetical protein
MTDKLKLAMLTKAARNGASDEDLALMVAKMDGHNMVALEEPDGQMVHVKVERVRSVGPNFGGGTILEFNGLDRYHPKARLVVVDEVHKVVRKLKENGWDDGR